MFCSRRTIAPNSTSWATQSRQCLCGRLSRTSNCSSSATAAPTKPQPSSRAFTMSAFAGLICPRRRWSGYRRQPQPGAEAGAGPLRRVRSARTTPHSPDHLAQLIATIRSLQKPNWCYSRPLWCTPDGYCVPFAINLSNPDELDHFLNVQNHIPSCCVLHTRTALQRVGYWPEDVAHIADWRCWQRIIQSSRSKSAAYCPEATVLHFRARRNSGPKKDPSAVTRLRAIAQSGTWWPPALKFDVLTGTTEQSVFFEMICPSGAASEGRIAELRAGIRLVLDRLAWMRVGEMAAGPTQS